MTHVHFLHYDTRFFFPVYDKTNREDDGLGEPAAIPRPETANAYASMVGRMDALERAVIEYRDRQHGGGG